jgi:hypothetical protein
MKNHDQLLADIETLQISIKSLVWGKQHTRGEVCTQLDMLIAEQIMLLTEQLDDLRTISKHDLLDLEATRRENEYLQRVLEEIQGDAGL